MRKTFYEKLAIIVSMIFSLILVFGVFWILLDTSCFPSSQQREMRDVIIPGMLIAGAVAVFVLFLAATAFRSWRILTSGIIISAALIVSTWLYSTFPLTTCVV